MGRAPCCEKMGLKRGPWSPEEDRILTTFIHNHGHSNWRALPKLAGLLRCGKSCRLRWTNYLKPDIKRGNFTKEEEDTIINLHELLGNRWSAIAAKLPGRTDNEIKNVWHTHLKKRLQKNTKISPPRSQNKRKNQTKPQNSSHSNSSVIMSPSSQQSSSCEISSATDSYVTENEFYSYSAEEDTAAPVEALPPIDESFWSEVAIENENENNENENNENENSSNSNYYGEVKMEFPMMSMDHMVELNDDDESNGQSLDDDMEFWYDVFIKAGGISELPEF